MATLKSLQLPRSEKDVTNGETGPSLFLTRQISSRDSTFIRKSKNQKTRTVDGAKIVENGKVYRQIFEAEVQLHHAIQDMRSIRDLKPPATKLNKTRGNCLPVVNNMITVKGMLDSRGLTWAAALPNEPYVENPIYIKQMHDRSLLTRAHSESELISREVVDLPDLVRPAKLSSNILDRIVEKRREKHNQLVEDLHQELCQVNKNLEPRIAEACDEVTRKLADSDLQIEQICLSLSSDDSLVVLSITDLNTIWSQVSKQSKLRSDWIQRFDNELTQLEDERILLLRNIMTRYCELLERSSHMAPAELHRLIDDEVMELNQNLLHNRRAYADLATRIMMSDIDREHRQHQFWQARVDDWKNLNTAGGLDDFRYFMSSEQIVSPANVTAILDQMRVDQGRLVERRNGLLMELKTDLKPPKFTNAYVYEWDQRMIEASKELDHLNQIYLKKINAEYESVIETCHKKMEALRAQMINSGFCTPEEAQMILKENCINLIGEQQALFESNIEQMDKTFEAATQSLSKSLKSLFKFCQGASQLWDRHEVGLAGQERKLAERVEASRAGHEASNQDREAQLDMAMDRMRQEATETSLKDCLKKVLDMMEKIKSGYLQFHNQQLHIVKSYPGMVSTEVEIFEKAICQFFGLKKTDLRSESTGTVSQPKTEKAAEKSMSTKKSSKSRETTFTRSSKEMMEGEGGEEATAEEEEAEEEQLVRENTKTSMDEADDDMVSKKSKSSTKLPTLKDILTTAQGSEYMVLAVAGRHGPDASDGKEGLIDISGRAEEDPDRPESDWVDQVIMDPLLIVEVKRNIRQNFMEFLDNYKDEAIQSSKIVVAAKSEELENELKLRMHLHEPRPRRAELDVHNVRAAELVLHSERVLRHCKGIGQTLSEIRARLHALNEEHNLGQDKFKHDLEALDEVFNTATKSTKIANMGNQLTTEVNKFMENIRNSLRQYRQHVDDKLQMLRDANAKFIRSFKLFSEGGNFCPEEVDDYRKRLEKMGLKIDESETMILSELEGIEKTRQDYVTSYARTFEDRFRHQLTDLIFIEKMARWLTNTQVKIKAEVADSNSQAQKLASLLDQLELRVDSCERPNLDKETVTPEQVNESLLSIFQACQDRSVYLNCVKTNLKDTAPAGQGSSGGIRVTFNDPTPISRTGRQATEDPSIAVIQNILSTQRQRTAQVEPQPMLPDDETEDGQKSIPGGNTALQNSSGDVGSKKAASRKGSISTAALDEKRRHSAGRTQFVSKNQRLDKKYIAFGEEGTDQNETAHFNGKIRLICRESLEGMLFHAENYYRIKGLRPSTRPLLLQENFDLCAEAIIQKLISYTNQTSDYHNTCLQEFRTQLLRMEELSSHIPILVFNSVMNKTMEQIRADMKDIDHTCLLKMKKLDKDKEDHQSLLRPAVGHPNRTNEMSSLCETEHARHLATMEINTEHKGNLHAAIFNGARCFAEEVGNLSEKLLLQWDNLLTVDEVEKGKSEQDKHTTSELLRRQIHGEVLEEDENRTLIPRGKHTWPALPVQDLLNPSAFDISRANTFSTPGIADDTAAESDLKETTQGKSVSIVMPPSTESPQPPKTPNTSSIRSSSKPTGKSTGASGGIGSRQKSDMSKKSGASSGSDYKLRSVVTAKRTMAHNATIEGRNLSVNNFRKEFQSFLMEVNHKIYKQEVSEQRWNENWEKSISTIKMLY